MGRSVALKIAFRLCPSDTFTCLSVAACLPESGCVCVCECTCVSWVPNFTLLSLRSQTSDLSEAAEPSWPRWQSRWWGLRPRRRPWRLQTGEGREGWPAREQAWRAPKQDIQSKCSQQEREPTGREVSEGDGERRLQRFHINQILDPSRTRK